MRAERARERRTTGTGTLSAVFWVAVATLLLAQSAAATFAHTPYTGPQIDFTSIEETTQAPLFGPADPEPIWGAPSGAGNALTFSPTAFNAIASYGTYDDTHSTLEVHMSALNPGVDPITFITVTESGYVDISGSGTLASGAVLLMGGTLTLTTVSGDETFTWGGAVIRF